MSSREGQQLGNYRLLRLLGAGGFAEVYLGEHVYLGTQAAIKVLQTRLAEEERERFLQEARIIARLVHPHIVRVLEFGVEAEVPFLVMDYAPKGTLRSLLPRGAQLSPASVQPYIQQVAEALHYAHARGLVHRDVKPENMLLGRQDEVLLGDFGIALIAQSTRVEKPEEVFGTASYMAPEQIRGEAEPASDQYALGVVLYEWLCGEPPFHGSFTEVCSQHLLAPPPPLRERVPGISLAVEAVVERALVKQPDQRFPDVLVLASTLAEASQLEQSADMGLEPTVRRSSLPAPSAPDLLAGDGQHQEGSSIPPTQAVPFHTPALPVLPTLPAELSRPKHGLTRRAVLIGAGAVGLAAAGGVAGILLSHREAAPSVSTSRFTAPPSPSPSASSPAVGTTFLTYQGHTGAVYALTWSPNGQYLASASADTTVRVWNSTSGETLYTYHGHSGLYNAVYAVSWATGGRYIASAGADRTVQVWEAATGNRAFVYRGHLARVLTLAWSPNNRYIASAGADRTVQVWEFSSGKMLLLYPGHTGTIFTLAWSPDGTLIASGGADKTVQVWEAATGTLVSTYRGHADFVYSLAFSPDGREIASGGADRTVQVWEASTGKHLSTYHGHTGLSNVVSTVAWSPAGPRIASGSTDKTVQLWNANTGKGSYTYRGHSATVFVAGWSPAGARIASGSADTTVRVWRAT